MVPELPDLPAPDPAVADLFDRPARWRGAAILALGLEGEERVAAASPGAGFPSALRSLADGLQLGPGDVVVELGAGLGGVGAWLRARTRADVYAVEPADGSRAMAGELFPELRACADVADLHLGPGTVDAVVLAGVLSLVQDADGLVAAASSLLRPGGRLGITDVVPLNGSHEVTVSEPNVVRAAPVLAGLLARHGLAVVHVGHGPFAPSPLWRAIAGRVDARVADEHAGDEALVALEADRAHLRRLEEDLELGCVALVAVRHAGGVLG